MEAKLRQKAVRKKARQKIVVNQQLLITRNLALSGQGNTRLASPLIIREGKVQRGKVQEYKHKLICAYREYPSYSHRT